MHINRLSVPSYTNFRSIEETKRSESTNTTMSPMIEKEVEKRDFKSKYGYSWKTMSAVAGAGALILLAVLNRKSIAKVLKKADANLESVKKN